MDADPQWLCHLNLVFAIGLQLCRDITAPSPVETGILRRLEGVGVKRAETFYHNAKGLKDPVLAIDGGELADVQSLLLAAIYMLASSKRNSAWGYLGKWSFKFPRVKLLLCYQRSGSLPKPVGLDPQVNITIW